MSILRNIFCFLLNFKLFTDDRFGIRFVCLSFSILTFYLRYYISCVWCLNLRMRCVACSLSLSRINSNSLYIYYVNGSGFFSLSIYDFSQSSFCFYSEWHANSIYSITLLNSFCCVRVWRKHVENKTRYKLYEWSTIEPGEKISYVSGRARNIYRIHTHTH